MRHDSGHRGRPPAYQPTSRPPDSTGCSLISHCGMWPAGRSDRYHELRAACGDAVGRVPLSRWPVRAPCVKKPDQPSSPTRRPPPTHPCCCCCCCCCCCRCCCRVVVVVVVVVVAVVVAIGVVVVVGGGCVEEMRMVMVVAAQVSDGEAASSPLIHGSYAACLLSESGSGLVCTACFWNHLAALLLSSRCIAATILRQCRYHLVAWAADAWQPLPPCGGGGGGCFRAVGRADHRRPGEDSNNTAR